MRGSARSGRRERAPGLAPWAALLGLLACGPGESSRDAGPPDAFRDAGQDARPMRIDTGPPPDSGPPQTLAAHRDRLFSTFTDTPCETWAAMDASRRAVFLTLTHRLHLSRTPDGVSVLAHVSRLHAVLGGGAGGDECGGIDNNRLFLSMDAYLWARMVETWERFAVIEDGSGAYWIPTRDIAGPHDPFDASAETDTGLRCRLLTETSDSRPPTAQAHFFLAGSAMPVERGGTSIPTDPYLLEIDHDFDCVHRSNPTCSDFESRYRTHYGDFECDWVPSACSPVGEGCYRSALAR